MSRRYFIIGLLAVAALCIAALACLPPATAQAVFASGGRKIAFEGAQPFKDLLDPYPPGIFYLYGCASWLFNSPLSDFRIFDALVQLITLSCFFFYINKHVRDPLLAAEAVAIYALLLLGSGADNTALPETFAFVPALLTFMIGNTVARDRQRLRRCVLWGILTGLLFLLQLSLNYTLIAPTIATLAFVIFHRDTEQRQKLVYLAATIGGIVLGAALVLGILSINGLLHWAKLSTLYGLSQIGSGQGMTLETIRNIFYEDFAASVFVYLTPTVVVGVIIAIVELVYTRSPKGRLPTDRSFYIHLIFQLIVGGIAVLAEGRNLPHHYSRLFWIVSPLAALGIGAALRLMAESWRRSVSWVATLVKRCSIIAVVLFGILFSPVFTSYLNGFRVSYLALGAGIGSDIAQHEIGDVHYNREQVALADSLLPKLHREDQVYIFGTHLLPYLLWDKLPPTPQLSSLAFRRADLSPEWKALVMQDIRKAPPKYIAVENADLTADSPPGADSYGAFVAWEELFFYVLDHYSDLGVIGNFQIFERDEQLR